MRAVCVTVMKGTIYSGMELQMSVLSKQVQVAHFLHISHAIYPYGFSVKLKQQTVLLWIFVMRSSTVVYLRTSIPLGHSIATVDVPGA